MNKIFRNKNVAIACILLIAIAATFISITGMRVLQYKGCIDANDNIRNVNLSIEPKCDPNEKIVKWYEIGYMGEHGLKGLQGLKGYEITRDESGTKSKMAILIVDGMAYEFDYIGADNETSVNASVAIFDHVVNSFNVK